MNNLNCILIDGNLVKDPVVKQVGETKVCNLVLGVNKTFITGENKITDSVFPIIEIWGKAAENCEKYLEKGRLVRVIGELKQKSWSDDKGKHTVLYILASHVEFGPKKNESEKKVSSGGVIVEEDEVLGF